MLKKLDFKPISKHTFVGLFRKTDTTNIENVILSMNYIDKGIICKEAKSILLGKVLRLSYVTARYVYTEIHLIPVFSQHEDSERSQGRQT